MSPTASKTHLKRCRWRGIDDPLYSQYHDLEWGMPQTDDRILFEKLCLESFQSGLSWLTILRKRENFRKAFDGFEADKIARYKEKDIARLMNDVGIVRNQAKILATIENAKAFQRLAKTTTLAHFLWAFVDGKPIINKAKRQSDVPSQSNVSVEMSKALKKHGFRFVGPTTAYSLMQAMGMVNDHILECHRHKICAAAQRKFRLP